MTEWLYSSKVSRSQSNQKIGTCDSFYFNSKKLEIFPLKKSICNWMNQRKIILVSNVCIRWFITQLRAYICVQNTCPVSIIGSWSAILLLCFAPARYKLNQQLEGFAVTCNFIKLKKKCYLSTEWKFTRGLECYIEGVFKVDEHCLNIFY